MEKKEINIITPPVDSDAKVILNFIEASEAGRIPKTLSSYRFDKRIDIETKKKLENRKEDEEVEVIEYLFSDFIRRFFMFITIQADVRNLLQRKYDKEYIKKESENNNKLNEEEINEIYDLFFSRYEKVFDVYSNIERDIIELKKYIKEILKDIFEKKFIVEEYEREEKTKKILDWFSLFLEQQESHYYKNLTFICKNVDETNIYKEYVGYNSERNKELFELMLRSMINFNRFTSRNEVSYSNGELEIKKIEFLKNGEINKDYMNLQNNSWFCYLLEIFKEVIRKNIIIEKNNDNIYEQYVSIRKEMIDKVFLEY